MNRRNSGTNSVRYVRRLGPLVQVWTQHVNNSGVAGRCPHLLREADDRHASLEHTHPTLAWPAGRDDRARRAPVRRSHDPGNERKAANPPRHRGGTEGGQRRSGRASRPAGPDHIGLQPGRRWCGRRRRSSRPAGPHRRELRCEPVRLSRIHARGPGTPIPLPGFEAVHRGVTPSGFPCKSTGSWLEVHRSRGADNRL
jgi:hypothetical protein